MKPDEEPKKIQHPALEIIEEAMKRGEFDNLPGKGKPLPWDTTDLTDPLAAAAKVRQNAEVGAPWQNMEFEIRSGTQAAERDIVAAYQRYLALVSAGREKQNREINWTKAIDRFTERMNHVNSRILSFNLLLPRPLTHLQKPRLKVEECLLRLGIELSDEILKKL